MSSASFDRPAWQITGIEWFPVLIGLISLYLPTVYGLASGIWQEDDYAHGPIILAVFVWLVWDRRRVLLSPSEGVAPKTGVGLLVLGLLFYILGRSQGISFIEVGALIPILAGVALAMRGRSALLGLWFALLFLIYLVPLPGTFVDGITGPLKQQVSSAAEQILYMAGFPIARSGVILTIGQYQLLVADACSGLNSMFSLSAVGLLYLYLTRRASWLHNGLIVASLLPIAFIANVTRVMFLVLVTYYFGDEAGQGFLHKFSGMVLFVMALMLVLLLDAVLSHLIKKPASA